MIEMCKLFQLAFYIGLCSALIENQILSKKYTLRIVMILPVGGTVVPVGDVCTESLDLLLKQVNSQTTILKDYNVLIDIIDDGCNNARAIRRLVPELLSWRPVSKIGYSTHSFVSSLPRGSIMAMNSANTIYTLPILAGSLCSGVCKAIGRFPHHFNVLEVASGCIDITLDDKKLYPNFFRAYKSSRTSTFARIRLIDYLGFNRVATISDATQYTYNDVFFFITQLSKSNTTKIAAEEFFQSDPTEALSRLRRQDIRIIFAVCYVNNCPAIACAAYKMNYYGPNMVWIFNSDVDLLSRGVTLPPGCDSSMTDKFAEGILYLGTDFTGQTSDDVPSEVGLTSTHVIDYIRKEAPKAFSTVPFPWRLMSFEALHNAINIANDVENTLNKKDETLAQVFANSSRSAGLTDMFITATRNMDFQATWGRAKFGNGYEFSSPPVIVDQLQDLKRVVVLVEKDRQLLPYKSNRFLWRTSDGKPPKSKPTTIYKAITIPAIGIQISRALSALVFVSVGLTVFILLKTKRFDIAVASIGSMMLVFSNILYPNDVVMHSKCAVITAFLFVGFAIVLGILCIKLAITFLLRRHQIFDSKRNHAMALSFPVWMIVNIVLVTALVSSGGSKPIEVTNEKKEIQEMLADSITIYTWKVCSSETFILGYVIIAVQSVLAVIGVFCGLITHYHSAALLTEDIPKTRACLYVVFTMTAALLMIQMVIQNHLVIFFTLNIFSLGTGILMTALFALPTIRIVHFNTPVIVDSLAVHPTNRFHKTTHPKRAPHRKQRRTRRNSSI